MTEKKNMRQQDQVLRGAENAPQIGKINVPANAAPAAQTAKQPQKRRGRPPKSAQGEQTEQKPRQTRSRQSTQKRQSSTNTQPRRTRQSSPAKQQKPANVQIESAGQPLQQPSRQPAPQQKRGRGRPRKKPAIKAYFLGGLNEIGKNFTVYECQGDMIIVDCGLAFPDDEMFGVDLVIPDFTFVEKNRDKIKGIVITHGHEDHIGAVPYLLKKLNVPVYATALTIGLIQSKLQEHTLSSTARLNVVHAGHQIRLGCMDVEFIHVNHSIADAVALAIHSPAGVVVHTGDFKIDCTPAEGHMIDLARFAQLGKEGVLALLADSTNADRPGYTQTEQTVHATLDSLFQRAEGKRIIVATFASSISRVQMIIDCAVKYGRKVALSGRSMVNVMGIASELGYLNVPDGVLVDLNLINRYEPGQLVLITTGSQGEPMSALTRMAFSDHRQVAINQNDFIIISARPIPGNEKTVGAVVDELLKQGCTVIYESMYEVHVSGHACQEELKLIQGLVKPKFFIPVHGEQKHLQKHKALAMSMGVPEQNIFIGNVGNAIEISEDRLRQVGDVPAGDVMVDGLGVGDVGSVVLRDRKHLAEDGLVIAVCTIDSATGRLVAGPDVVSRGFVYVKEAEQLMAEARKVVRTALDKCARQNIRDWATMKQSVKDELSRFLYRKTQRSPMVLPVIMEV